MSNPQDTNQPKSTGPYGHHRSNLLINPRFQVFFLGFMAITAGLVIATVYLANIYFFWKFQKYGTQMNLPPEHVFYIFLEQQKHAMNGVFAVTASAVFLLITIMGLIISHRIAGPLFHLTKHLKETANNHQYRTIKFREKDFFPELAEAYNNQLPVSDGASDGVSPDHQRDVA